jgi:D-proline reductase (dithiol) PrdB
MGGEMNLFARLKVWERFGRLMNSRYGVWFINTFRGMVELLIKPLAAGEDEKPPPFTPLERSLSQARVALVTTTGVYVQGQEPFDVDAVLGDSTFRAIPSDVEPAELRIAHTHYPHERALEDINVIFPVQRLREFLDEGVIGSIAASHYSFGFDLHVKELINPGNGTAHAVARALKDDGVNAVFFTPG